MNNQELIEQLEEIVGQLGIELFWDDGEFTGGICRVGGRKLFLINRGLSSTQRIKCFCQELSTQDLSQLFILPGIRQRIEDARKPFP